MNAPAAQSALDAPVAGRFARIALANVEREYPHHPQHVMHGPGDLPAPRALHPSFYGSYDWHSCVHMHWLLVRVRRLHPTLPESPAIDAVLDRHFEPAAVARECAYLARPDTASFERTYGWAWLLELAHELARSDDARARRWSLALAPLAQAFVARYLDYLPKATYPLRHGMHANSAFGLAFALDYALACGAPELAALCRTTARRWYGDDRDAPARFEPSGADFLSPALAEADLMRRVLDTDTFAAWLEGFLPGLAERTPSTLFEPVVTSDRSDPQIVHLDGLNLSRSWHFAAIAAALPAGDARRAPLSDAAAAHLVAGMRALDAAHYVGTHWLATFAALALGASTGARLLHSSHDQ